ncbi:DUF2264 domain-containing protein [Isoptericola sp. QY 916]|uniref:DUF2264 domain-containing protein n=1 Tax=Isoptericola sp. QY 916 TaxID=2782570 RepID=UPI003D2FB614|nr:DUF2264 domain-containing protein [Isoptericola sp. QY 916]
MDLAGATREVRGARPPGHHAVSGRSRWDRGRWAALADTMLDSVRPFASPDGSLVTLPGPAGGYGRAVDGLEGYARTFLLAGFRLAGERGADPHGYAERYAAGLAAGTDPRHPERWVRLSEHGQAKVEAASIALVLDLTRPWIWDRLDPAVQERVVDYLAEAVGDDTYPRINWVWFRLVVQTFLRSVGGPHSLDEMAADLATHDSFERADGWMSDGAERAFDHYAGWALHLYPTLWARMAGAADLAAPRRERDVALLDRFLQDAVALVGGDGSPLVQGRSLTYRFAAAAPFWVGAMAEVPSLPPGLLRRAASAVVGHFVERGAPDDDGLLRLGWHHAWPRLAQSYSGPGSPYWASKGLLGLALPADHPAWTAPEEPLPVERGDELRVVRAPGWVVSGTRADGVVRVVNHGTDHAREGDRTGDSPLYARLGYSTATCPWLDDDSWLSPVDQSVSLVDATGRATHRTGMTTLEVGVVEPAAGEAEAAVAASRVAAHWVLPAEDRQGHGSGATGDAVDAGVLTVVSVVRGPWEVRCVRADALAAGADCAATAARLRVSGWPTVAGDGLSSVVAPLLGDGTGGTTARDDVSPLGEGARVPWVDLPAAPGAWAACLVALRRSDGSGDPSTHGAAVTVDGATAVVVWPDGARTTVRLP